MAIAGKQDYIANLLKGKGARTAREIIAERDEDSATSELGELSSDIESLQL